VSATQHLTEFLSVIADRSDGPAMRGAAVDCAARALHADLAVLLIDGTVAAAAGVAADRVRPHELAAAATGDHTTVELDGAAYAVASAAVGGVAPGLLLVGRRTGLKQLPPARAGTVEPPSGGAFGAEEIALLRGMARVLELSLVSLHRLEAERRTAKENDRLLDFVRQRQRLFEHLTRIQREIARRTPFARIFQIVTEAGRELLDAEMCALSMVEPGDGAALRIVAATGIPAGIVAPATAVPLADAGISGLAVHGGELVAADDYAGGGTSPGHPPTDPPATNPPVTDTPGTNPPGTDPPVTGPPGTVPALVTAGLRSAMAAPIRRSGRVVGCLTVGVFATTREWDKTAQEMLKAFAEHISLAITDAQAGESLLDPVTGLHGRAPFLTRLEEALTDRTGAAVLLVDLDRFKVVNDALGHTAGDALLAVAADRIRSCLRDCDTAARLGADEFAVLLPGVPDPAAARPVAERILARLREPFRLAGGDADTYVSARAGIAHSEPGRDGGSGPGAAQQLMVRADLAMQAAKAQSRDRIRVFEPALQQDFRAAIELEADLRRAVARHEFELRYQPIVHLQTGEITGVEALIRWRHPTRGVIAPMDFIPLAEQTGMIVPIGDWVLREACARVAGWNARRSGRPLTVSVNLSAVQLEQGGVLELVRSALVDSGLPADRLVLELTESVLIDHRPATLQRLEDIKALGVRLAIDDFGTGYSSLAYLRRFPVDIIKIDKSFIDDVADEPTAAALTHGIIRLGQALQLATIAEGIEDAGQLSSLTGGNCELGQGYFFAEPLTGPDLDDLLFRGRPPDTAPE
jgi:diguanylate cyclase (GGDEF)-like protein